MANRTIKMTDELYSYILNTGVREPEILKKLRIETGQRNDSPMQIAPEQGQFMALLVKLLNAQRIIEVGVYTGYSSLAMASALPADGYLLACDINEETTAIAQSFWQKAGLASTIDLRLGPALNTLKQILAEGGQRSFDMAFIDADKTSYDDYYETCLKLLRQGGVILLDNMLWGGAVADSSSTSDETNRLKQLNIKISQDERVDMVLLPLADGITIVRKR